MGYCGWASIDEADRIYHDTEWGIPVHDDRHMFEHLTLECLQCGLSWALMLKKREIFRECFDNFDYNKIAAYDEADVERILNTEGMIRSPRKVNAIINNARCYQKVREEFGSFCDYIWGYSDGKTILYNKHGKEGSRIPVSNGLSNMISNDLKKRGFKYVGAITIYSHLQACGIICDHDEACPCRKHIIEYPEKYDRLLCGGIWCIVQLNYEYVEEEKKNGTPIRITKLTPIQMPHIDIEDLKQGRQAFTKEEWLDVMLRSIGMEPDELSYREKWLLLTRMIPLVENNFNLCELGPRSTGKSHLYKEISPNSILVSGGQTTVANLFYNMGRKTVGLVGLWDCVAFDEVAGIKFKDKDGVQIMKDYMASGSFARGKEEKAASASMVFVGNINQSVDVLLKTSSLFDPFPPEMGTDTAFLDRIHCYLPGWEIPKFRPEHFTND